MFDQRRAATSSSYTPVRVHRRRPPRDELLRLVMTTLALLATGLVILAKILTWGPTALL